MNSIAAHDVYRVFLVFSFRNGCFKSSSCSKLLLLKKVEQRGVKRERERFRTNGQIRIVGREGNPCGKIETVCLM